MNKTLIPFLIGFLVLSGLPVFSSFVQADTVVVMGEPVDEPIDEEPPQDEPPQGEPPQDEPPPGPQPILATINITPKTLNLNSEGKFITASVGLPDGFDANQIDRNTLQISAIDGHPIEPICAGKTMEPEIESDNCLLAKFERQALGNVLVPGDEVEITIEGVLTSGEKFTGADTIRVIDPTSQSQVNSGEKKFIFHLGKHLSSDCRILKALLCMNYRKKDLKIELGLREFLNGEWSRLLEHRFAEHYFLPTIEGGSYEWDLTETVKENWNKGIYHITISIDYDSQIANGRPALIVAYEGSGTLLETAIQEQDLTPIGPRFGIGKARNLVKLFFRKEDIQKMNTENIKICGWDESASQWEVTPDSKLDPVEHSVTTKNTGYCIYQIMYVSSASSGQTNPGESTTARSFNDSLCQNYPNPFNPSTTIDYAISQDCHVTLKLYNVCGQLVATIVDEYQRAGSHSKYFDAGDKLSRGIYYYQLKAGDFVDTKRMVILK